MKRIYLFALLFVAGAVHAAESTAARYLISTRKPAPALRLRMVADSDAVRQHAVRTFENINAFAATLTDEEVAELRRSGDVISITPVVPRHASAIPTVGSNASPFVGQVIPWGLDAIRARQIWPVTRGSKNVNVAVLDTGIDDSHPDLKNAIAGQYSVYDRGDKAFDDHNVGHGTHVAGTIAAADNAIGIVGIAPDTRLWAVKVLNSNGDGSDENIALGLDWVISRKRELGGAWIVNFSLGAPRPSDVEKAAVERAIDEGIIIVAAAGNRAMAGVDYPAGYEGVIAVNALNQQNEVPIFSSFGTGLTLAAPGVDLPSTVPLGRSKVADIDSTGKTTRVFALIGSPLETVTGQLVYCGYGRVQDFPPTVAGNIAIVERGGNVYFGEKSRHAKLAGARAVVMVNDDDEVHEDVSGWSLFTKTCDFEKGCQLLPELEGFEFPLSVSVSRKEGADLIKLAGRSVVTVSARAEDYAILGGTSMAAPHVAGTVALLLALNPTLTASQLEFALITSTVDLGPTGWDLRHGYGALDALSAAHFIAAEKFGVPQPKPRPSPRRRATR